MRAAVVECGGVKKQAAAWLKISRKHLAETLKQVRAFRDYLRNGAGEWFRVHAITRRCQGYCEAEKGKETKSYHDERNEWERHRREHTEEYPAQAELDAYRK